MRKFLRWLYSDPKLHGMLQGRYNVGYAKGYSAGQLSIGGLRVRVAALEARAERLDKLVFELRTRGAGENDKS
jgi:hypothetical protein